MLNRTKLWHIKYTHEFYFYFKQQDDKLLHYNQLAS